MFNAVCDSLWFPLIFNFTPDWECIVDALAYAPDAKLTIYFLKKTLYSDSQVLHRAADGMQQKQTRVDHEPIHHV